MLKLYGSRRMPGPVGACPSTYVPMGYAWFSMSVVFCVNISAHQSLHPSPMPPLWMALSALELDGPPVRRLETPWPNSWLITPLSRSPSREGEVDVNRYICMRGACPSGGVAKFALFVP